MIGLAIKIKAVLAQALILLLAGCYLAENKPVLSNAEAARERQICKLSFPAEAFLEDKNIKLKLSHFQKQGSYGGYYEAIKLMLEEAGGKTGMVLKRPDKNIMKRPPTFPVPTKKIIYARFPCISAAGIKNAGKKSEGKYIMLLAMPEENKALENAALLLSLAKNFKCQNDYGLIAAFSSFNLSSAYIEKLMHSFGASSACLITN